MTGAMHDIRAIRADPAAFDAALARRGVSGVAATVLAADTELRAVQTALQEAQARRNSLSKEIGQARAKGDAARAEALTAEVAALKADVPAMEEAERQAQTALTDRLAALPNLPADDVPDGTDEHGNIELVRVGTLPVFDFPPLEHDLLAVRLGYDPDAAARIAGARFAVLSGGLARLHRALAQYMLDVQVAAGWQETMVPLLVRADAAYGTGQLPKFEDDLFRTTDGRYLIPTAEMPLTNLVREQVLDADTLPLRLTALTPCFRSEAGSAGRDTRGLIRQHQFEKVELVSICTPEQADTEHAHMLSCAEDVLVALGLAYRRMLLCAGDMGAGARRTYDLEVWLPGQNSYREISSVSWCGDWQARRMEARWKTRGEKGSRGFVHTLNGSGLAVGRTLVAVLENYQQADGRVRIPEVLHPYMGDVTELVPA
jgi:seryl-tRNA synthetase